MIFKSSKRNTVAVLLLAGVMAAGLIVHAADNEAVALTPTAGTLDYLDPFDLTVTQYVFNVEQNLGAAFVVDPAGPALRIAPPSSTVEPPCYFLRPLIRIPYKPEFRSPCILP